MTRVGMLFAWIVASAAGLCGATARAAEMVPPDTLIALQRGPCEQRCAIYRLVIFADGTVIYEGQHFVRRTGLVKSGIAPAALARLIAELEAGGFFALAPNYGVNSKEHCETLDDDGPVAVLSVSGHGRSRTVLHNHGCGGPIPRRITELEDAVDRAVNSRQWIR